MGFKLPPACFWSKDPDEFNSILTTVFIPLVMVIILELVRCDGISWHRLTFNGLVVLRNSARNEDFNLIEALSTAKITDPLRNEDPTHWQGRKPYLGWSFGCPRGRRPRSPRVSAPERTMRVVKGYISLKGKKKLFQFHSISLVVWEKRVTNVDKIIYTWVSTNINRARLESWESGGWLRARRQKSDW